MLLFSFKTGETFVPTAAEISEILFGLFTGLGIFEFGVPTGLVVDGPPTVFSKRPTGELLAILVTTETLSKIEPVTVVGCSKGDGTAPTPFWLALRPLCCFVSGSF